MKDSSEKINESVHKLKVYIESEEFRGFDPYDALTSELFKIKLFNNKIPKFGIQQLVKRSPINLRPILGIRKGYNPVTLGLCIQGFSNLIVSEPANEGKYRERIIWLIEELKKMIPAGYHGACWGYDFPWQARYATINSLQPTIVATGIITNALYIAYKKTGINDAFELCKSASDFVLSDLNRHYDVDQSFCFSYSPFDNQEVYNASAKGIRLLSQVYAETGNEILKKTASEGVRYIINKQQLNGSWYYSNVGRWIDNYHTGYVLDCLEEYSKCTGDNSILPALKNGFEFYHNHFIHKKGLPRIKADKNYPVDCTAAAQTLLTLIRFGDKSKARDVALWMIDHMQAPKGYFYYRKNTFYTTRISFMRWSNAWMFAALTDVLAN